ncbi:MAG: UDP-N-acetylmuramoyl-L-alanyl-D-glutamate--2,6-diaminopimelate ligase [Clostridia bacterium]|nr:UDP-N-acetylmuramoyl-L-alanyl-D-glutamate--2,6-diaminopimelate ligase [Clostridia bacterium]
MKLKFLCQSADILCPKESETVEIGSIVTDSRRAGNGCLFICIRGTRTDGHKYIEQAVRNGCRAVLIEEGHAVDAPSNVTVLRTKSTRRAAAMLYNAWYGDPVSRLHIIGVTGTNGKTSVTYLLRAILESAGYRCGLIGTVGCESIGKRMDSRSDDPLANMTTPDPEVLYGLLAEMVRDGVEYVVMEVSSHALALEKTAPMVFDVGIFTNLTAEHLDFHRTMESYAKAKAELFAKSRISILNHDSPYAPEMERHAKGSVIRCSQKILADACASNVRFSENGVRYDLHFREDRVSIHSPIAGLFTVMNTMQAALAARALGVDLESIRKALLTVRGIKGRMEPVVLDGAEFRVLIDYAHTPDALKRLLQSAQRIKKPDGRVVLLFGCGGDRDRSKRGEMGRIASLYADLVIVTSDNSRGEEPSSIIEEICAGILPEREHQVIPDRREAIYSVVLNAKKDDLILLAGKGHEEYEIIRDKKLPFSEREIVRAAFAERAQQRSDADAQETDQ